MDFLKLEKIIKIEQVEPEDSYDLEVEDNNNFFANNILVHNCRCIADINGLWTRNGKKIVSCPHIEQALIPVFERRPELIIDGEIYNHQLRDNFEKIISLARKTKPTHADIQECAEKAQYHIYDLCSNTQKLSQRERIDELNHIFQHYIKNTSVLHMVVSSLCNTQEEIDEIYGYYLEQEYEGQMLRYTFDIYMNKRTSALLKRKEFEDDEFEIVDILEGIGNWQGFAKSVVIRLKDGSTQQSGIRGSQEFLKTVLQEKEDYISTEVTVRYQNKTSYDKLRFPVVVRFWKGKRDV